ncbi:MAG: MFS transporter [candidate division WOR-3 bacterium]|nr:MFS transporter [candidate division WOR-3 bacterium]MCX7757221.1 MFS transporter [candidate division WOR-3 bacterium]MDW7987947.1 MFS transporter [candidate division WOR-3 bacterium]
MAFLCHECKSCAALVTDRVRRSFIPLGAIQALANFAPTLILIYIPLIAASLNARSSEIGLVISTYHAMIFLSGIIFGRLADLKGRKPFILLGLGLSSLAFLGHLLINNLSSLFLVRALAGFCLGMFPSALITYAYEKRNNLGVFSSLGSLGWGIGSVIAGLIGIYRRLYLFSALGFLLAFLIALFFLPASSVRLTQRFWDIKVLKKNWRVYLTFLLRHVGAFGIWAIFPLYLAALGANKFWIGIIYSINSFGQFLFMPLLDRFTSKRLITYGLVFSSLTFLIFAICRNHWQILPFQVMLAFSWSALYLGTLKYLMENNEEKATAVGIFNSLMSLSGIIGPVLGGIVGSLGYRMVMVFASGLTVISFIFFHQRD